MSLTYGFYNSLNHDRKYNAVDISSIFDGIIHDGIFMTIGTTMCVQASSGMNVIVGVGRGWFNHTWTYNDSEMPLTIDQSETILDRIDAIVIEINASSDVRANSIKYVKGTPSSNPVRPTMIATTYVHQYPLCYISVRKGVTSITQADITNMVGTSDCPFITGVVQSMSTDLIIAQWESQFNTWFDSMKGQLSTDAAGSLQTQINAITSLGINSTTLTSITDPLDLNLKSGKYYLPVDGVTNAPPKWYGGVAEIIVENSSNRKVIAHQIDNLDTTTSSQIPWTNKYCLYPNDLRWSGWSTNNQLTNYLNIPINTDINSIETPGMYSCSLLTGLTNCPTTKSFKLKVSEQYIDSDSGHGMLIEQEITDSDGFTTKRHGNSFGGYTAWTAPKMAIDTLSNAWSYFKAVGGAGISIPLSFPSKYSVNDYDMFAFRIGSGTGSSLFFLVRPASTSLATGFHHESLHTFYANGSVTINSTTMSAILTEVAGWSATDIFISGVFGFRLNNQK